MRFLVKTDVRLTTVCFFAVLAGWLAMLPYVLHTFSPLFQGLTIERDKDYANYDSRLERALTGHPEEAANAITPVGSHIDGLQVAGVEEVVGSLFAWTGLSGPTVSVIVSGLLAPVLFLLFFFLCAEIGFDRRFALGITLILFAVMFHGFTRVVHPGWSFVPTIAALFSFFALMRQPRWWLLILSIGLLGIMPYVYFWSWTFDWAVVGSFILLSLFASKDLNVLRRSPFFLITLAIGILLLAIPFGFQTISLFHNPIYPEVAIRASFLTQRTPESPIRSSLLVLQLLLLVSLFRRYRTDRSYLAVLALLLGITLAMHQNVIHQRVLMFASHYEPHLIIASTIVGAWVVWRRVALLWRLSIVAISCLFLAGGIYDYNFANAFFIPQPSDFHDQHLAPVIADLQTAGPQVVLTDADTGRVVTSWTDDGIVYTTHARFLLISDAALVERFCVSEIANPTPQTTRVLDLEYNRILQSPAYQDYQKKLITETCARVQADPLTYLKKYGVTMLLWNKDNRPTWKIDAPALHLEEVRSGMGWVLFRVKG